MNITGFQCFRMNMQEKCEKLKEEKPRIKLGDVYFRALIENAADGVAVLNRDGRIVYLSPAIKNILGFEAESLINQNVFTYIHPQDRFTAVKAFYKGMRNSNYARKFQLRVIAYYGEWINIEGIFQNQLKDKNINGIVINYRDVSLRNKFEIALSEKNRELEALAEISSLLRSTDEISDMVSLLTEKTTLAVGGDSAAIYLLDSETNEIISSGLYFNEEFVDYSQLSKMPLLRSSLNEGVTGYVVSTGEVYFSRDISTDPQVSILPGEKDLLKNVRLGLSVPLWTKHKTIGVLHIFFKNERSLNASVTRLAIAMAEIGGNAIYRAMLYKQVLNHNNDLFKAYENTLMGWARALELRDQLTEDHTRRVTDLCLRLSRIMGFNEEDLISIRWGAILHDIGKMGVPDTILHKQGPLSEDELKIMRLHPLYAYEMLSQIPFLCSSLDIPLNHHEHWDGNGYPRGIKGEEIPLSARVFTIIDVYDALTSDRPYRKAWPKTDALEYIRNNSGTQFDPVIVTFFLKEFSNVIDTF